MPRQGGPPVLAEIFGHLQKGDIVLDSGAEIGMNKTVPDFRLTTGLTLFFKP
jgi:hypothetical protein